MMFADLHMHTNFSDGTYTPEELAGHAHRHGLALVALTDHDTVEGCARMELACGKLGVEFIAGSELTAEHDGNELHIIGYFLDTHHPRLLEELAKFQEVRQNRIREMVVRLNQVGIPLAVEKVFAIANCRAARPAARGARARPGRLLRDPG
jgi:predicted metal-dependent phosphoesterase TrpH